MSGIHKLLFGAPEKDALFATRGFPCDNPSVQKHLEKVGHSFLIGYNNCLSNADVNNLQSKLEQVEKEYKGFSYEGAAMGYAMLDAISFSHKMFPAFAQSAGQKHIYMLHVGAGWAYAKLPFGNVEKKMEKFDPLLKWLVMDGYGFCKAYFETKKYVYNATPPTLSNAGKHVFYQGLGRSLWFVEGTDPKRIVNRINNFSKEFTADLWSGVGLASAYAGGVEKSVIEQMKQLGEKYILNLGQGASFAAAARIHAGNLMPHTDMACMIYCGINANTASEITEASRKEIEQHNHHQVSAYESWRSKINQHLAEALNKKIVA